MDLAFIYQPNMVLDSGVHSSLQLNFYHQIVFAKIDLKFFILHRTKDVSGIINMQILFRSKKHLHPSTGNKRFLIAVSIRRFLFLIKQLSMLWLIIFPMKQRYLMTSQSSPWMNASLENLITTKHELFKKHLKIIEITVVLTSI